MITVTAKQAITMPEVSRIVGQAAVDVAANPHSTQNVMTVTGMRRMATACRVLADRLEALAEATESQRESNWTTPPCDADL